MNLATPYYIIHKNALDSGLNKLKNAVESVWPNYLIAYSYKTNALPWVISYFKEQGCHAEVVSDDEYALARSVGVEKNHLIYNGVAKSKATFLEAVKNHALVNLDAEYEIDWLNLLDPGDYDVGVRVNFDLESKCPGQTQCGEEGERFGFCYENGELEKAIEKIRRKNVMVSGLHLHKSSRTRMPDIYKAISETAVEIARKYDMKLKYVDIGGGFFGGLETKPQFPEYFDLVSSILREQFTPKETTLVIEPGMALIGPPIEYITTVLDIKKTNRSTFVITDGSRIHIDPMMTKTSYFFDIRRSGAEKRNTTDRQIVSGFTCMEHDRLFCLEDAEELLPGDQIVYHKVGAYTMCLSPLFIKWFPDVYVKNGDSTLKIRSRWTTEEYMSRSSLE